MIPEQLLDGLDRRGGALDQRIAVAGIGDRRFQHIAEFHGAVIAQQQHPGFERAGDAGRQQSGAGHHLEALAAVMRDGRALRCRTLAANHLGAASFGVVHDDRHVAARAVQMRLDHLQGEGGGDAGIEGVAAFFENAHPDRGGDPVRRGDDAESAFDFRPRGERIGIDIAHGDLSRW